MKPKDKTLMSRLKWATREYHINLMHSKYFQKMFRSDFKKDLYISELKGLYKIYTELEKKLVELRNKKHIDVFNSYKFKSELIKNDLNYFKVEPGSYEVNETVNHYIKNLNSDLEEDYLKLIGYFYVIEGSTLGTSILKKHLKEKLNLTGSEGTAFLTGNDIDPHHHWDQLTADINNLNLTEEEKLSIIKAAENSFKLFLDFYDSIMKLN